MGACCSCNHCGKCTEWITKLSRVCLACKAPLKGDETHCPQCGKPLPLPPGISTPPAEGVR